MDINDDEEDTPRTYVVTDGERRAHFTGPIRAEAVTHDDRLERAEGHIASLLSSRKNTNRALWFVIPALIASLGTVLVFAAEMIATSAERVGETRATIDGLKERLGDLKDRYRDQGAEIAQLRATLLRLGAGEPRKPTSGPDAPSPGKLSLRQSVPGSGASVPASTNGDSGSTELHVPKLQYLHTGRIPVRHSMLLLQKFPHDPCGSGSLHVMRSAVAAATTTTTTHAILCIPEM